MLPKTVADALHRGNGGCVNLFGKGSGAKKALAGSEKSAIIICTPTRASSSVGQSWRLITAWSRVQVLPGPPKQSAPPGSGGALFACRETRHAQEGQHSRTMTRVARVSPLWNPLSTKFYGKPRTRRKTPRTQFAAKFPCRCRHHRRVSADGDRF